jgi:hypothetical protein
MYTVVCVESSLLNIDNCCMPKLYNAHLVVCSVILQHLEMTREERNGRSTYAHIQQPKYADAVTQTEPAECCGCRPTAINNTPHCTHTPSTTHHTFTSQQTASSHTDSQMTDDSHCDRTYQPELDSDLDSSDNDDMTGQDLIPVEETAKYLVFENQINKLFKFCPDCGASITGTNKYITGTMLSVSYSCQLGHNNTWHSQTSLRRMPAGNLLLSAAILLSGSTYSKAAQLLNILHMPILSESEFYRIQNTYLNPTINDYWTMHQTAILSVLSDSQKLRLCGDARSDSPGYSAKYTSYTLMDMTTSLIVDQQLVSLNEDKVESSVAMEKIALERSLDFVLASGLNIDTLATDRHIGVQSLMKNKYPEINHQFDVWHFAKNITKRLHLKAQNKNATELMPWIHSVSNHLYWCSQSCGGDPILLKEKWSSCLHHIVNRHHWDGDRMSQCEHETVNDKTAWLTVDSCAFIALESVVCDKRVIKDIEKLTDFCHTGRLEVYHSTLLKYATKRQHFQYGGMQTRLQLAALDHNHNVDRDLATDCTGNTCVRQIFSKARKDWVLRNIYDRKQYTYIDEILHKIVDRRRDKAIRMDDTTSRLTLPHLKPNIATTDKPNLQESINKRYCRM